MKKLFLFAILFATQFLFAQSENDKKIYLDSLKRETIEKEHFFYRIIKDYKTDKNEYNVITYYKSGKTEEEKTISYKEDHQGSSGKVKQLYENGNQKYLFIPYGTNDSIKSISTDFFENGIKSSELIATHKGKKATLHEYYPDGKKKEIKALDYEHSNTIFFSKTTDFWDKNGNKTITEGNGKYFYEDDSKKISGDIKNGMKVNNWSTIDKKKGKITTLNYTEAGLFVKGEIVFENGEKRPFNKLETQPIPKNGYEHFVNYFSKNFNPSSEAVKNKIGGRIILEFLVEENGSITEIKLIKGLGYGLDQEAIRLLSAYENWLPGLQQGEPVKSKFTIPLAINLK